MKLERDSSGNFIIDAAIVADRLSASAEPFRRHMRMGLVTSIVETGAGSDEGHQRLSVRYGNAIWRAVVDADHNVLSEEILRAG